VFAAVSAPLGNIDKLVVIDQGNSSAENGSSSLGRLAQSSPAIIFNLLQQLEALGLNVPTMLQQLGVTPSAVSGQVPATTVPPVVGSIGVPPKR
jgi:lipase chaperone LimK